MNILFPVLLSVSLFGAGAVIVRRLTNKLPLILSIVGAFLVGHLVGIPVVYGLACLFEKFDQPVLWGTLGATLIALIVVFLFRPLGFKVQKMSLSDIGIIVCSLVFSTWLMFKTFHGGAGGRLFVGSNNIFDFGLAVGLVRSISWGTNIPFSSPFFAGLPMFYHFFFIVWAAIWEYFGVPTVWAINIPSIISFTSLLVMVYYLPQFLLKQKKLAGWVSVLLTITHSTLTFWHLVLEKGLNFSLLHDVWRLPTYPFAGPFDGSAISIFVTLNNYVNQRHLAFGIAVGLFLIINTASANSALLGILTGSMFLWNIPVSGSVGVIVVLLMLLARRYREAVVYSVCAIGMVGVSMLPFFVVFTGVLSLGSSLQAGRGQARNVFLYWWENLGILPFVAGAGFFAIPKTRRYFMIPFFLFFVVMCIYAGSVGFGNNQKFFSFLIIGVNIAAASGLVWLWNEKKIQYKLLAVAFLFILTISGFVDLMVVKNEFAYPLVSSEMTHVISWIKNKTPKEAVFISYSDMIDPVVLAGRKNYFGFYGNIGWYDRSPMVRTMYTGDSKALQANSISYILVPKWQKNDFPYAVNIPLLRTKFPVGYEDPRFVVFTVR